jgi:hypothetical protein
MIRYIHCIKRRDDISIEAFRRFWSGAEFNGLLERMLAHFLTAEVRRNLTLDIDLNKTMADERGAGSPFDAVLEIIWESGDGLLDVAADPEYQRLNEEMERLQAPFVDFRESRRFFTEYQ